MTPWFKLFLVIVFGMATFAAFGFGAKVIGSILFLITWLGLGLVFAEVAVYGLKDPKED
jgi:hypothetical protein